MRNNKTIERQNGMTFRHPFRKTKEKKVLPSVSLSAAQKEWQKLQIWVRAKATKLVLIIEGTDEAAKQALYRDLVVAKYSNIIQNSIWEEDNEWHLQNLMAKLPTKGKVAIFKDHWYTSAFQTLSMRDADEAYRMLSEVINFEKMLTQSGFFIIKIGLNQGRDSNSIINHTEHAAAPWKLWESNRFSVNKVMETILASLPFQDLSFSNELINQAVLKQRAYNLRWATVEEGVIPLTAADPDFPIAQEIRKAITDYTESGVFSYGPGEGLPEFRKAAAKVLRQRKKVACHEDLILPVDGAASGMFTIARCTLKPGDEAIIFDPVDFLFQQSIEAAGATVVRLPFDPITRTFDPKVLKKLLTPKTKMIAVCNPHNPMGRILNRKELEIIGTLAVEHNLWIMNDEIWSDIVYEPDQFISIASIHSKIAARTITVHGFSKTFGLAGLRVGFIAAPNTKVYKKLLTASKVNTTAGGATTISQIAATAAYADAWHWADAFVQHLKKVRNYSVQRLNAMEGVSCQSPEGTYVLFVNIASFGLSSEAMADYLLKMAKVAVVPGAAKWFGPGAEGHIRLCFSTSMEMMQEALNRIENALRLL